MIMVVEYAGAEYFALVYQGWMIVKSWKGADGTMWARMEK